MQEQRGIRGDYFTDRLGGVTQIILALASLGITLSRFKKGVLTTDIVLAVLFGLEVIGALLIIPSKLPLMKVAFWLFTFRVVAGLAYMGMVHDDKLARTTLGFPFLVAIYCWTRVRALKAKP